jgi:hypothetical protein
LFVAGSTSGQALGGNSVFNFLKLSNTPQLTALGGINVSQHSNDVGLAFNDPALLRPSMHMQLNAVFHAFYAATNIYHLSFGYHSEKLNTSFAWGVHYFDYGNTNETDAAGNILGKFHPTDWVMQVSASRKYLQKWNYGGTLKFISSNYGQYRSNGLAMDAGLHYYDSVKLFSAGALIKNLGFQLKRYEGSNEEDLPFDLQFGITQRLRNAPFSFSLTAQHAQQFNIHYADSVFNNAKGKLIDHLVLATSIYLGDKVEVQAGYNFLRRRELNIGNAGNGLNGFSLGAGFLLGKLQVRYARAYYQSNSAYNQFGIAFKLAP